MPAARRVADDRDAAARRAVQRRRWWRGRDRRGARDPQRPTAVSRSSPSLVHRPGRLDLVLRLGGHVPQAAGAHDHPPGRLARPCRAVRRLAGRRHRAVGVGVRAGRRRQLGDVRRRRGRGLSPSRPVCCSCCRSVAPTCRSSSRCSTPSPASPSRRPATCSATSCSWWPARSSVPPARSSPGSWRRRWDGRSPRRSSGRSAAARAPGPPARRPTARCARRARTTSRSCSATPEGRSSSPATGSRSRRRSTPCASWPTCCRSAASRSSTASTLSPAGCPGT